VAVPSWYFVPALLCGNTCVWKPSEDAPKSAQSFYHLLIAAGIPKGVFNVVFGGSKTGADLVSMVDYGLIDKVGFTGSTEVGKKIGEVCGRNLQVPCLELGGKNPLVVMPDANLDMALEGVVWAAFGTAGQRCTSLGNLILHKDIYEEFVDHLLKKVESLVIGNPMRSDISYGPMISQRYLESHLANLSKIAPHHQVITKKNGRIEDGSNLEQGFYAYPTIVANVQKDDYLFQNETFGPLFNIAHPVSSLEEAIDLANGTKYGLSSAIYTSNMNAAYRFKSHIKAGMTSINNSTTGAEAHLPFGGNGWSGNGSRQSGIWVVDQFTRWQSVNMDLSGKLQLAQMDTSYITPKECIL
jgi:aldehyde dehydrogenase (NAD+)